MSQRKDLLDRIEVREPCTESWEEMTGNDEVRFCSHCSKNVVDLSAYTRARAEKLVRDSNGGLCVRYRKDERGRVVTAPPRFTQINRHAKIAAGVLATTMSVASMAYTQGSPRPMKEKPSAEKREKDKDPSKVLGFVVSGIVTDSLGAVVAGAEVSISSKPLRRATRTDNSGIWVFEVVEPGLYELEIDSPGFKKVVLKGLNVDANRQWDVSLDVLELMGVIVIAGEPIVWDDPPLVTDKIELQKTIDLPKPTRFVLGAASYVNLSPIEKKPSKKLKKKLPK